MFLLNCSNSFGINFLICLNDFLCFKAWGAEFCSWKRRALSLPCGMGNFASFPNLAKALHMLSHFSKCILIYVVLPEINSSGRILISTATLGISPQVKLSQCLWETWPMKGWCFWPPKQAVVWMVLGLLRFGLPSQTSAPCKTKPICFCWKECATINEGTWRSKVFLSN